jgi:putative flippase GtrA
MASSTSNPIDRTIVWVSSRFGPNAKEVERLIKFFIVGIIGAVVDFTTLNILQSTVLVPIDPHHNVKIALATGIAFGAAVFSNFIWNRYWTYPDSRSRSLRRQLVMFYGVNTAALTFRLVFVSVTFSFWAHLGEEIVQAIGMAESLNIGQQHQLGTNIAQALAVGLAMIWNYSVNRWWTYNDVPDHSDTSDAGA